METAQNILLITIAFPFFVAGLLFLIGALYDIMDR